MIALLLLQEKMCLLSVLSDREMLAYLLLQEGMCLFCCCHRNRYMLALLLF